MKKYNAIIVDDEKKNIEILEHFIIKFCPLINVVKTLTSIDESIKAINTIQPDILYLDIQLKKGTSFDILNQINKQDIKIIFITAFKDFAIKAIKNNAIDYILKPLSIEDVVLATNKAIAAIEEKKNKQESSKDYLTVHSLENIEIVRKKDLIYCESDGRYTILYLKDRKITASKNLKLFEVNLKTDFIRVHNSFLINIMHIKVIHKKNGIYCEMSNGKKIPISKRKQYLINEL